MSKVIVTDEVKQANVRLLLLGLLGLDRPRVDGRHVAQPGWN